MLKIGLTGGIGSGKSIVCEAFSVLSVPIFNADLEAKQLYDNEPELVEAIVSEFGSQLLDNNKRLNKKKLASIIFNDENELAKINSLVHPLVKRNFERWCSSKANYPYVIEEAAILFESKAYLNVDKIITVTAPESLRIARAMKRDGLKQNEVEARISKQISETYKIAHSNWLIVNDGESLVLPEIIKIHQQIINTGA